MIKTWLLLGAAVLAGACGDGDEDTLPPYDPKPVGAPVTMSIGAAGGSITSADGKLTLTIPAGALAADTAISIQELELADAWAWRLGPEGTTFAMPIDVEANFSFDDLGTPTRTFTGNHEGSFPVVAAMHQSPDGFIPFAAGTEFNDGDTNVRIRGTLDHFSDLVVRELGKVKLIYPSPVKINETFSAIAAWEPMPPKDHEVHLFCGGVPPYRSVKTQIRETYSSMRFRPWGIGGEYTQLTEATPYDSAGVIGFIQEGHCNIPGTHTMFFELQWAFERADGAPWPSGCMPNLSRGGPTAQLTCLGTCTVEDPRDVFDVPGGDYRLDIVCVQTGTTSTGRPWVRVSFLGPWPPPPFYSWYTRVTLSSTNGTIGSVTKERHDGVDRMIYAGGVSEAATTFTIEPAGYLVLFDAALAGTITSASVETGLKKEATSPFVMDTAPVPTFDAAVQDPP